MSGLLSWSVRTWIWSPGFFEPLPRRRVSTATGAVHPSFWKHGVARTAVRGEEVVGVQVVGIEWELSGNERRLPLSPHREWSAPFLEQVWMAAEGAGWIQWCRGGYSSIDGGHFSHFHPCSSGNLYGGGKHILEDEFERCLNSQAWALSDSTPFPR